MRQQSVHILLHRHLRIFFIGNEENIGVVTLCKLCQGLEMTVSEIFGDEMFERNKIVDK